MSKKKDLGILPVVAAAAANPEAVKKAGTVVVKTGLTIGKIFLGIIAAGTLYYFSSKMIKSARYNQWRKKAASDINVQAAISLFDAIPAGLKKGDGSLLNPFGFVTDLWNQIKLIWVADDTSRVLDISVSITDLEMTAKAFKIFYDGQDLYELLHKALSPSDYDIFFQNATKFKEQFTQSTNSSITGKIAITKRQTIGRYYYSDGITIYKKDMTIPIPANSFVGRSTGKIMKDKNSGISYMELSVTKSRTYLVYLPQADIKNLNDADFTQADHVSNWTLGEVGDLGRGVKTTLEQNPGGAMRTAQLKQLYGASEVLVVNKLTAIYDNRSKQVGEASRTMLLGKCTGQQNGYYQFETIGHETRFVKMNDVTLKTL